jgi:hypothetical protein
MRVAARQSEAVRHAVIIAGLLAPYVACGADAPATPTVPATSDDRIVLSADGSTLTGTNGGAGASVGWLHNFDTDTLGGIAVEHQALANSEWTFGSINASKTLGAGDARYSVYGEAHEGAGNDQGAFKYSAEAVGVIGSFFHKLSVQIADKRFDILQSHGNLPTVGISYQWDPHIATSVSYAYTVGGNLGTRLTAIRVDATGPTMNYLAGVAFGTASPAVLNLQGYPLASGSTLREGYVGISKPFPQLRGDLTVVADYIHLSKTASTVIVDSSHVTLTVNYIFHIGHR